jgi:hypothetical protein
VLLPLDVKQTEKRCEAVGICATLANATAYHIRRRICITLADQQWLNVIGRDAQRKVRTDVVVAVASVAGTQYASPEEGRHRT